MLGNSLSGRSTALSKHLRQISGLSVHKLFAASLEHVAFKSVRVDYLIHASSSFVDHVVSGSEVTLLKGLLLRAVSNKKVVTQATFLAD